MVFAQAGQGSLLHIGDCAWTLPEGRPLIAMRAETVLAVFKPQAVNFGRFNPLMVPAIVLGDGDDPNLLPDFEWLYEPEGAEAPEREVA